MNSFSDLQSKKISPENVASRASKDSKALEQVLRGVSSDKARVKYGCAKALRIIAERSPEVLYPHWDFFVNLLGNENTFLKSDAIFIIGHLTRVDTQGKFEKVFDKFYKLLDDESMITAANLVGASSTIAQAKPGLQTEITNSLLRIDETHHGSECKNVMKGHLIRTFDTYFQESKDKRRILDFARKELNNTRPSTRKKAEMFLRKWKHQDTI